MNLFHIFTPSLGYAVNKQELTIEINLCLLHISACRHGNFRDVTASLVDRFRQKKFNVHFESIFSSRNDSSREILDFDIEQECHILPSMALRSRATRRCLRNSMMNSIDRRRISSSSYFVVISKKILAAGWSIVSEELAP